MFVHLAWVFTRTIFTGHIKTKEFVEKYLFSAYQYSSLCAVTVAVLLTNSMRKSIDLLIATREKANINPQTPYLFPIPKTSHSCIRGADVLRKYSKLCNAKAPENIKSTLVIENHIT